MLLTEWWVHIQLKQLVIWHADLWLICPSTVALKDIMLSYFWTRRICKYPASPFLFNAKSTPTSNYATCIAVQFHNRWPSEAIYESDTKTFLTWTIPFVWPHGGMPALLALPIHLRLSCFSVAIFLSCKAEKKKKKLSPIETQDIKWAALNPYLMLILLI